MNVADRLATFPLFAGLDALERTALADAAEVLEVPDGKVLIAEGAPGDGFFVVLEGRVVVSHESEGRRVQVSEHGPGELMGIVSLIDHGHRSATCSAIGPGRVAWYPTAAFQLLHGGSPRLSLHFQKLVARQLARDARALNEALVRAMTEGSVNGGTLSGEFHVSVRR